MNRQTMAIPPPLTIGGALNRTTGTDKLVAEVKKLERENRKLRERVAELERKQTWKQD